eukprot:1194133-Prymnesium_polylepis.2
MAWGGRDGHHGREASAAGPTRESNTRDAVHAVERIASAVANPFPWTGWGGAIGRRCRLVPIDNWCRGLVAGADQCSAP